MILAPSLCETAFGAGILTWGDGRNPAISLAFHDSRIDTNSIKFRVEVRA